MSDLLHWHKPGEQPSEYVNPPQCCRDQFDHAHGIALDLAVHHERQRVVLDALEKLDAYRDATATVLPDPALRSLVGEVVTAAREAIRKAGCICPLIDVTQVGQRGPKYLPGGDRRCGLHGEATA